MKEFDYLHQIFQDCVQDEQSGAVYKSPGELHNEFDLAIPEKGRDLDQLLDALKQLVAITPKTSGRRFLNQLFGARVMPSSKRQGGMISAGPSESVASSVR